MIPICKTKHTIRPVRLFLIMLLLVTGLGAAGQTQPKKGNLKVVVTHVKGNTGQLAFYLFNSDNGFPIKTGKALKSDFVKTTGSTAECTFRDISAGTYAVFVFHDADNDKKLKTNFVGMPREGMGVSNNAKGHFGPPDYDDAKFNFNKSDQTISISLTYL